MLDSQSLLNTRLQRLYIIIIFGIIFSINIFMSYQNYLEFKKEIFYETTADVVNIYKKENNCLLRLKTKDFTVFTSTNNTIIKQNDIVRISLITSNISFFDYLKGFLTKNFRIEKLNNQKSTIQVVLSEYIVSQHQNSTMSMLYTALFLAIPPSKELINFFNDYGMSHLIAISGYHLGVLSAIFYFILNAAYSKIHQTYLPYRNKRVDISMVVIAILFLYLILIDLVASFLRSFIMFVFGFLLLRSNIKILSFENLLITVLFILAFFQEYLFSVSLWFSVAGVFYIFLFIQYYKDMNKYLLFFFFNFWIFMAVNPITQYFFGAVSLYQLASPFLGLIFTIFYPLSLLLHLIGYGCVFDEYILMWFNIDVYSIELFASVYFVIPYILLSVYAIWSSVAFRIVEISFVIFNLWLFVTLLN
ncbi:MAG: ComEC/Rec2 family competence protein [Arcobacteraceae bacterium]|nr:ComEC/Rec2 family competence protein [Arcobacteraceae bacterium]